MRFDNLKQQLERQEGFMSYAYQCPAGKWTVGIGRNIDKNGGKGITKDEAYYLLENDIKFFSEQLKEKIDWFEKLDEVRQDVLVNMAFNMGVGGILTFSNTLRLIKDGDYKDASVQMLKSKWAVQVGMRAKELSKQLETGQYQ